MTLNFWSIFPTSRVLRLQACAATPSLWGAGDWIQSPWTLGKYSINRATSTALEVIISNKHLTGESSLLCPPGYGDRCAQQGHFSTGSACCLFHLALTPGFLSFFVLLTLYKLVSTKSAFPETQSWPGHRLPAQGAGTQPNFSALLPGSALSSLGTSTISPICLFPT